MLKSHIIRLKTSRNTFLLLHARATRIFCIFHQVHPGEGKILDTIPLLPGRYAVPVSVTLKKLTDTVVTGHSTFRNACLANCQTAVPH